MWVGQKLPTFRTTVAIHLQGQAKALRSLDMSLTACQFTRCNVLEDLNINGKACLCPEYDFFFFDSDWLDESAKGLEILDCNSGERT